MPGFIPDERELMRQALEAAARMMGPGWDAEKLRLAVRTFQTCLSEIRAREAKAARKPARTTNRKFNPAWPKAGGGK